MLMINIYMSKKFVKDVDKMKIVDTTEIENESEDTEVFLPKKEFEALMTHKKTRINQLKEKAFSATATAEVLKKKLSIYETAVQEKNNKIQSLVLQLDVYSNKKRKAFDYNSIVKDDDKEEDEIKLQEEYTNRAMKQHEKDFEKLKRTL